MSDDLVFREVDDELRQEQLQKLWRRYGGYVLAVALLIVLGVASYRGWEWYVAKQAAEAGVRFEAVLRLIDEGKTDQAKVELATLTAGGSGGYPDLARFVAAGLKAQNNDRAGAIADYDALSTGAGDDTLRALARIEAARLSVDESDRATIEQKLAPVLGDNSPWRHAARELVGLAAYRTGDVAGAASLFRQIATDPAAPQETRQRAEIMLAVIAPQEAAKAGEGTKK